MSSDVKRYDAYGNAMAPGDPDSLAIFVLATDYAALEAENARLRQDNIALARNLRGNVATTGATYEHLVRELDTLRIELESIRAVKMECYRP